MKKTEKISINIIFFLLFGILPFTGLNAQETSGTRPPINVNLIIDGSKALADVKEDYTAWLINRLDSILSTGDNVAIWLAGAKSSVLYSGRIGGNSDLEAVKKCIRDISVSTAASDMENADFTGALLEASRQQNTTLFNYTLLISAAPEALSSAISGPQANLFRFSRVEEFPGWRALVIALNLEPKVKAAAAAVNKNL